MLAVIVGEDRALVGDAVYVRRAVAHLSAVTREPMSSPMMTRMFGFGCCAQAGAAAIITMGHVASRATQRLLILLMVDPDSGWLGGMTFDR